MPKFFFPRAESSDDAEDWYAATVKFNEKELGRNITERRIFHMHYMHDGKEQFAQVGQSEPRTGEPCEAILETTDMFLVCTTYHGVKEGSPLLVGLKEVLEVEDFE